MMRLLLLSLLFGVLAQAGMYSTIVGMTVKERKPIATYTLDTIGYNPRVYEFTPVNDPNSLCIALFSSSDKSSTPTMQCFKVR